MQKLEICRTQEGFTIRPFDGARPPKQIHDTSCHTGSRPTDDDAVAALLAPLAGRPAADVADALDAALGDGVLRDDAAFVVVAVR